MLICRDGLHAVASVVHLEKRVRVFDLEVEPNPNFFAAGILVHNKSVPWRIAMHSLKTLTCAKYDFRSNDRDGNGIRDFWIGDLSGLYRIRGKDGEALKLLEVSLAQADADPRPGSGGTEYEPLAAFEPKAGYAFRALRYYEEMDGTKVPYDSGKGRNDSKFGLVAYPHAYSKHSYLTLIVSEGNTVFKKDLHGISIDTFPRDPQAAGWEKPD